MTALTIRTIPSETWAAMEPWYDTTDYVDDIERYASDVWESWTPLAYGEGMYPRLDMYEEKDELVLRAELPGVKKEDIKLNIENGYLTISAERKQDKVSEDSTYYSCESYYGTYTRSVLLPYPVDTDKISATLENGLLDIRLPKAEEAKAKQIEVKVK